MDKKLWMWAFSVLVLVTVSNCINPHVQTIKCVYYNQTLCDETHGKKGCGDTTQECIPAENEKPSYCYAVWTNNSKTNELTVKLKVMNLFV